MALRRVRGAILRLVRRRTLAIVVGSLLAVPAIWAELFSRVDAWWIDGLALVCGATGLALIWIGLTGASPDWVDTGGS
jgi:hypothetical protein